MFGLIVCRGCYSKGAPRLRAILESKEEDGTLTDPLLIERLQYLRWKRSNQSRIQKESYSRQIVIQGKENVTRKDRSKDRLCRQTQPAAKRQRKASKQRGNAGGGSGKSRRLVSQLMYCPPFMALIGVAMEEFLRVSHYRTMNFEAEGMEVLTALILFHQTSIINYPCCGISKIPMVSGYKTAPFDRPKYLGISTHEAMSANPNLEQVQDGSKHWRATTGSDLETAVVSYRPSGDNVSTIVSQVLTNIQSRDVLIPTTVVDADAIAKLDVPIDDGRIKLFSKSYDDSLLAAVYSLVRYTPFLFRTQQDIHSSKWSDFNWTIMAANGSPCITTSFENWNKTFRLHLVTESVQQGEEGIIYIIDTDEPNCPYKVLTHYATLSGVHHRPDEDDEDESSTPPPKKLFCEKHQFEEKPNGGKPLSLKKMQGIVNELATSCGFSSLQDMVSHSCWALGLTVRPPTKK